MGDNYTCACLPGYTGQRCETDINECESLSPCGVSANCVNLPGNFVCKCEVDFTGELCDTRINDCEPHPCLNGGTCVDGVRSYTCNCFPGFYGDRCQQGQDVNECQTGQAVCGAGEKCINKLGSYDCVCPVGTTGPECSINIDDCVSSPCQHGAVCTDLINDYSCECCPGWNGKNCSLFDKREDVCGCESGTCDCNKQTQTSFCKCLQGFEGDKCQTNSSAAQIERQRAEALQREQQREKEKLEKEKAVRNRNIGIAVAFSILGVVAGAVVMWFYMKRKSAGPRPQRFGFDGVEKVNYAGGEMMYTNPAYSTAGDEGSVTFEPMPKL